MFGKDVVGDVTQYYIFKYNWLILDLARNHMKETIVIGNISLEDFFPMLKNFSYINEL